MYLDKYRQNLAKQTRRAERLELAGDCFLMAFGLLVAIGIAAIAFTAV